MKKILWIFSLILIVSLSLLTLIQVSVFGFYYIVVSNSEQNSQEFKPKSFHEYQVTELNTETEEFLVGTTTITEIIEAGDSIFEASEGKQVLISHFGAEEYYCTGTCICDHEDDANRRNIGAISNGMKYLVIAATSILAVNLAETYFENECVKTLSTDGTTMGFENNNNVCPPESIKSEIEKCIPALEARRTKKQVAEDKRLEEIKKKEEELWRDKRDQHWCRGNCLSRYTSYSDFKEKTKSVFDKKGEPLLTSQEYRKEKAYCESMVDEVAVRVNPGESEVEKFQNFHLQYMCSLVVRDSLAKKFHTMEYDTRSKPDKKNMEKENFMTDTLTDPDYKDWWSMCVESHPPKMNPSIKCRKYVLGKYSDDDE